MHKKFIDFFEEHGFTIDKNVGSGTIGNYQVNIVNDFSNNGCSMKLYFICHLDDNQRTQFLDSYNISKTRCENVTFCADGAMLYVIDNWTIGKLVDKLQGYIDRFVNCLDMVGAKGMGYCPLCGETLESGEEVVEDGGIGSYKVHKNCQDNQMIIEKAEKEAFDSLPDNYGKGLLGALIGGLVAFGSAVVLALIGFISAISGFLGMFVGEKLYVKFGGKPTVKMIITLIVVTVATMILFIVGNYGLQCQVAYATELGESLGLIEALKEGLEIPEIKTMFIKDLVMTMIFTALGVIPIAITFKKNLENAHKVE